MQDEVPGSFAVVIPTLNAGKLWRQCLEALEAQAARPARLLVVDSVSTDGTAQIAEAAGYEVKEISRSEFNHGGTRQWAAEYLADCERIVFLTQDAVLAGPESLGTLVSCLDDPRIAVAYGRQLPHPNAQAMEAHARLFSYGEHSERKSLQRLQVLGPKLFFCSNSFAAYRRSTLLHLGGFRRDLILGEDAEFAARAILSGYANMYCADATVYHSHNYRAEEVFRRYFDTGVFHSRNGWLKENFGSHNGEGWRFVRSELQYLWKVAPSQMPRSLIHTLAKLIGYTLGNKERFLAPRLKRRCSMMPKYWGG